MALDKTGQPEGLLPGLSTHRPEYIGDSGTSVDIKHGDWDVTSSLIG